MRHEPFAAFEQAAAAARADLEGRHKAREEVLRQSRLLIQTSSKCIKHIHRGQQAEALALLDQARAISQSMREAASGHPDVMYAGHIQDSEKEMAEAAILLAMVQGEPMPGSEALGIGAVSWLHGAGEAASEARRCLLDCMREGRMEEAARLMSLMEAVYDELITFDFPDGLTSGLRRTCDALRAVIERTRSDLTLTAVQRELLAELKIARIGEI